MMVYNIVQYILQHIVHCPSKHHSHKKSNTRAVELCHCVSLCFIVLVIFLYDIVSGQLALLLLINDLI